MAETPLPAALTEAVAALWRMRTPGPTNLWSDPRFVRLCDACERLYRNTGSADATPLAIELALSDAVQALGLPIGLVPANAQLSIPFKAAATLLDAAFRQTKAWRVYLCPLDKAGDLPALKFGPNRIRKFTAPELEARVDPPRLKRINANWTFDGSRNSGGWW
jgi:hypothetical protein